MLLRVLFSLLSPLLLRLSSFLLDFRPMGSGHTVACLYIANLSVIYYILETMSHFCGCGPWRVVMEMSS